MSNKNTSILSDSIVKNPVLILFLGACPALAQTAHVVSALGIGLAALAVMLFSNIMLSLLKKAIPQCVRVAACVIVVAFFVSAAQMLMNAYLPEVYQMMGVYLAVLAVNLLVLHEAECSAKERSLATSVGSALVNGLGFTAALLVMAVVREVLGCGSLAGNAVPFFADYNVPLLADAPGGFIVFAILLALLSKAGKKAVSGSAASAAAGEN